jgi:hypothetical protein
LFLAMAVYYPFAKAAEKQRLNAERTSETAITGISPTQPGQRNG